MSCFLSDYGLIVGDRGTMPPPVAPAKLIIFHYKSINPFFSVAICVGVAAERLGIRLADTVPAVSRSLVGPWCINALLI
jgi:hypothetical protein